jgi:hypothetical protein
MRRVQKGIEKTPLMHSKGRVIFNIHRSDLQLRVLGFEPRTEQVLKEKEKRSLQNKLMPLRNVAEKFDLTVRTFE